MFEKLKQKRMSIMDQVAGKRDRLPSAERRKLVENEYNQFMTTMEYFKPHPSPFR